MKKTLAILVFTIFSACSTQKKVTTLPQDVPKENIIAEIPKKPQKKDSSAIESEAVAIKKSMNSPQLLRQPEVKEIETTVEAFDHSSFNELLQDYVTKNGKVNYKGLRNKRSELKNYISSLAESIPTNLWSKADKLAYWINAYNALTIDLILRNYPLNSIKDIKDPWDQRLWKLGAKWYNLNDIEHQILRKMGEPRIHFAIVCASFSCPKLQDKAFTAKDLETQLTNATKEFLADNSRNTITMNSLELSKIFKWFAKDFKQNGTLIDFLNLYSEIEISKHAKKSYKDYNWDLND